MGSLRLIPAEHYARVVRRWAVLQTLLHLLWAFAALIYFARGTYAVSWAVPVFLFVCLLGAPLYLGSALYRAGARDLVHARRWGMLRLALAPPLSAALSLFVFAQLRHLPEQLLQILQNTRSIEVFYKLAYPIANVAINLCLWLTLPLVGRPGTRNANPLAA